jgi:ATP-dependent Lon protease
MGYPPSRVEIAFIIGIVTIFLIIFLSIKIENAQESRRRTKELQNISKTAKPKRNGFIGEYPLNCFEVWAISPGNEEDPPGLYRIDINERPGFGIEILNRPAPNEFRESLRRAEKYFYAQYKHLVGDEDPRNHEFKIYLRRFDFSKSGAKLGIAALIALCISLLKKNIRDGLIIVGELKIDGSTELIHNATSIIELAIEKKSWHFVDALQLPQTTH